MCIMDVDLFIQFWSVFVFLGPGYFKTHCCLHASHKPQQHFSGFQLMKRKFKTAATLREILRV